ncbi:metal-dependent hydrolase [Candidatus Woesearchaeota archaeon]|nr:metal-dependent hydrolase [Candidatus Woesearchaeota archaeon]
MIFFTHLLGGILAFVYFGHFLGIGSNSGGEKIALILVAALFAILPDIDMVKSKAGRHLQPFSTLISLLFRHRGFLHSFIFAAVVYFSVRYLFSAAIAAAAAVGYSSHLLLDALTKEGVRPLSPLLKFRLRGPITTGSFFEQVVLAAMFVLLLVKLV